MTTETGILSTSQKYKYYETAVQCFESDIDFLKDNYKKIYNKSGKIPEEKPIEDIAAEETPQEPQVNYIN